MFLRRVGQIFEIYFEDEIVKLADMMDNQYVIRLAKTLVPKVNIVKNLTLKIWYAWLGHLSYSAIYELAFVALDMTFIDSIQTKIGGGCMIGQQQY